MFFEKVSTLILAGGESRRMGFDKANLMSKGGKSFVMEEAELIKKLDKKYGFIERYISSNSGLALDGFETITDPNGFKKMGPLSGILAGLKKTKADFLLVIPCDSPELDEETLESLLSSLIGNGCQSSAIVLETEKGIEPLIGIFPVNNAFIEKIEDNLKQGKLKVKDILGSNYKSIKVEKQKVLNINSKEDYTEYINGK